MNEYLQNGINILRVLKENNYEAYFVGGFVRDFVLKRTSNDIDITTSATPNEVISLFDNVKETGVKFGGVTVIMNDYKFEVTTFRHRHPSDVRFSDTLLDDLKRRDFTMNQLVMDEQLVVIDHHHGLEDIKNRLIRTINHPIERFNEDSLRMLRAFRFVSKLGFDIEQNTFEAIMESKELIHHISIERIMNELSQILNGDYQKKAIRLMNESKMSETLGLFEGFQKIEQMKEFIYPVEAFIICAIHGSDLSKFSSYMKSQKRIGLID
jgi:tRNA nucleotidyltransferase (CCA-adding enzyme)